MAVVGEVPGLLVDEQTPLTYLQPVFQAMNILAAAVDCMSARIGQGEDNYSNEILKKIAESCIFITGKDVFPSYLL